MTATATFIVLLGPPGVGKGTQSIILAEGTGLRHVSSGDLFREHMKDETELGKLAKSFIGKGELVPDDITIAMIRERISRPDCEQGAILDGFPRTPEQARALNEMLKELDNRVNQVLYFTAPVEVLVQRTSGRWVCREQGHIYHELFSPPLQKGICDHDGSELYQRDDDKVGAAAKRIAVYLEQTLPLTSYYQSLGILTEIMGNLPAVEVTQLMLQSCEHLFVTE